MWNRKVLLYICCAIRAQQCNLLQICCGFVGDLLYNNLRNKFTTNRINGVWPLCHAANTVICGNQTVCTAVIMLGNMVHNIGHGGAFYYRQDCPVVTSFLGHPVSNDPKFIVIDTTAVKVKQRGKSGSHSRVVSRDCTTATTVITARWSLTFSVLQTLSPFIKGK